MKPSNTTDNSVVRPIAFVVIGFLLILQVRILILAIAEFSMHGEADFLSFYAAGSMVDSGARHQLYDIALQETYRSTAIPGEHIKPSNMDVTFFHAPYEAALFAPFASLPYRGAFFFWMALGVGLLIWGSRAIGLNPLIACAFYPVVLGLYEGQDSFLLFALAVLAYREFREDNDFLSGAILALGLFKFQIVIPMAVLLIVALGWRRLNFAIGFSSVAAGLLAFGWALIGTSGMALYFRTLRIHPLEDPTRMANIRGIVQSLGGSAFLTLIVSAGIFLLATWISRGHDRTTLFSVALLAATLVSYHMHGYDLTLLLIPIGEAFRKGFGSAGAWVAALFYVPVISTPLYLLAINHGLAYLFAIPIFFLSLTVQFRNQQRTGREVLEGVPATIGV